ncbi:hypothetical protein ABIA54_002829 [Pseudomonas sp. EB276 TE3739]|uniref:hypothetical protein n=1 Tax=Pseudomonas TaxID=286 RepID=UPI00209DAEAB|nr:hypothetical protein [Pseudomonas koreensis]MCP1473087.1 hypothetical protein [Pseudomonas koreensis]
MSSICKTGPNAMLVNQNPLGPWESDRSELERATADGTGLYAAIDPNLEFRSSTMKLVSSELNAANNSFKSPVYFVLSEKEIFQKVRPSSERVVPLKRASRSKKLDGNLWFVPRSLAMGFAVDVRDKPAPEVFDIIESYDAGELFTVMFDPASAGQFYIYPDGVSNPSSSEVIDLISPNSLSVDDIIAALDGLYTLIRSPDQMKALPLWLAPSKWHPIEKAEDAVQNEVTRALAGRLAPFVDVRSEQPSTIGRTDIELIQTFGLKNGELIRHALIELKVLRSYGSTGKSVSPKIITRHISQGVRQAALYATTARIKMLCCYDMRTTDHGDQACFAPFLTAAHDREVFLKRYYLYNSSQALREALDEQNVAMGATALPG